MRTSATAIRVCRDCNRPLQAPLNALCVACLLQWLRENGYLDKPEIGL